jgi:hypothetical protein
LACSEKQIQALSDDYYEERKAEQRTVASALAFIGNRLCGTRENPNPFSVDDFFKPESKPEPDKEVDWERVEQTLRLMFPPAKTTATDNGTESN